MFSFSQKNCVKERTNRVRVCAGFFPTRRYVNAIGCNFLCVSSILSVAFVLCTREFRLNWVKPKKVSIFFSKKKIESEFDFSNFVHTIEVVKAKFDILCANIGKIK